VTLLLGAVDGAFYAIVMFILTSRARDYFHTRYVLEATALGTPVVQLASNERWTGIAIGLILIFAVSAYFVGRFYKASFSSVLFWELVGLIAVASWNVFMLTVTLIEKEFSAQAVTYQWVTSSSNWLYGPVSLGLALLINFLFGSLVRIVGRHVSPIKL
jgi:hypothetical protein